MRATIYIVLLLFASCLQGRAQNLQKKSEGLTVTGENNSLLYAGKITTKVVWYYFNPVFLKVVPPDKGEKHDAIFVVSSINARYTCEQFGGAGYIIDLYEKKNGTWHYVENLVTALN